MTSTSAVMLCVPQKSSISCVSADAADGRAGETAAPHDKTKRRDGQRLLGCADQSDVTVAAEQVDVGIDVVIGGNSVEDEIETAGVLLHLVCVTGDDDFVGTEAERVFLLAWMKW